MARERAVDDRDGIRRRGRRSSRVVKLAMFGGAVALLLSEDLRNQLLDVLFGAEEEFDYSTLTEPPAPSGPPRVPAEPFVRAQAQEPAIEDIDEDDPSDEQGIAELETQEADDEQPAVQTAGPEPILRSIAPSPAAWRAAAAAAEEERSLASETPQASGARSTDARSEPPAPPVGWWSPTNRGFDAG